MTTQNQENNGEKKILIVEDHPIFRMGLADLIEQEPDFHVCGHAESVGDAIEAIGQTSPDLVIVDLSLKTSNGLDLIKILNEERNQLPVLVLSTYDENIYAERCLHAGARGYINKKEASELVIEAIRKIFSGNIFLSPKMTDIVLNKFQSGSASEIAPSVTRLTDRELEVFTLIGQGMIPGDIAKSLHISAKTVYSHTERIKEKLKINHSSELVRFAALRAERDKHQS
ncbi:MAG: response regulator transcription factor [Proteobacteria bacterium]|nr:response regulator transcription factor [Pseudomonadota bacterium]